MVVSGHYISENRIQLLGRGTPTIDNQIAAGLFYEGLVPQMPVDVLGIGIARTNVNGRGARAGPLASGPAEYAAEVFHNLHPFDWLELKPNVQSINQPGGRRHVSDVGILGLKAAVAL